METKTIRLKIQCALDRNAMVTALANNGYKVWVKEEEDLCKTTFYVCFEIKEEE